MYTTLIHIKKSRITLNQSWKSKYTFDKNPVKKKKMYILEWECLRYFS